MLGPVSRVPACRQSGLCSNALQHGAAQGGQGPRFQLGGPGRGFLTPKVTQGFGATANCGRQQGSRGLRPGSTQGTSAEFHRKLQKLWPPPYLGGV